MSTLFVTSSGTEIGKTFITCALVRQLRAIAAPVRAIKPVVSGFQQQELADSDCAQLLAAQEAAQYSDLDQVSPWRFRAPLSPDMAAAAEDRRVPFEALLQFCRDAQRRDAQLIIEGIGGAMVPLNEKHTVLDWISALNVPTLLVVGSYLGSISHTLTTCAALAARQIPIQGIIVSESLGSTVDLGATCETIGRFLPGIQVTPVVRLKGPEAWRNAPDLLVAAGLSTPGEDR